MMQKKVCMLGAFAVGKTSLVSRFVESIFSERYYTTVGVKISKKVLQVRQEEWQIILWDIAGEDEFLQIRMSYLRGASGYLLVIDGTRHTTLETALDMQQRVEAVMGHVPFVVLLNKADLDDEWELDHNMLDGITRRGWRWLKVSAKTGVGVEEALRALTDTM